MKKFIALSLIMCFIFCSCGKEEVKVDNNKNYELVFEDNFDGEELDKSVWSNEIGFLRNNEPQYYTDRPDNASVKDGNLVITCKADDYVADDGTEAEFTSASLNTRENFSFTYGKVEMRAKLPAVNVTAAWPAFWMMGTSVTSINWPKCGEIDIMEMYGTNLGRYECNVHWFDDDKNDYANFMQSPWNKKIEKVLDESEALGDDWHTYGVIWDKNAFTFTFDDEAIGSFDITDDSMSELHEPMYLLVNLALTQEGDTNMLYKGQTIEYIIDYVRVYQEK